MRRLFAGRIEKQTELRNTLEDPILNFNLKYRLMLRRKNSKIKYDLVFDAIFDSQQDGAGVSINDIPQFCPVYKFCRRALKKAFRGGKE